MGRIVNRQNLHSRNATTVDTSINSPSEVEESIFWNREESLKRDAYAT